MHEKNISLLREEAERLLKLQINLLEKMQKAPHVLSKVAGVGEQTLDLQSAPKEIEALQGELHKLNSLEFVIAVVGTMKAGKSTTINAIVGAEVLPNRNRPMTALPTLIRHTPGVRDPQLIFSNVGPINRLIEMLHAKIPAVVQQGADGIATDPDMRELLMQISQKQTFPERHDGAEAIFGFLKNLNDLVRLCTTLGVQFPFGDYNRIENLPVIEVEFTHLRELKQTQGRLALLDTPGPNEAGQHHLRAMLQTQLKKASAVMAVLDYTQLKSDADDEVRKELGKIASTTEGRLFALVNKFDERNSRGDNEEQVRKYVSSRLMNRIISDDRVYPVSSKLAYLASRARNEISLHKKLPDPTSNLWVEDFAKEAFGPRWKKSQIESSQSVEEAATSLWEDSKFTELLNQVIGEAYANAAILAVDSAAAKMVGLAEDAKNFLGTKRHALKKNVEEIRRQIENLQKDIDSVGKNEKTVASDVKSALKGVTKGIQDISDSAQNEMLEILQAYFKEGKRIEAEQQSDDGRKKRNTKKKEAPEQQDHQAEQEGRQVSFLGMVFKRRSGQDEKTDFDPNSPTIKFDDRKAAEKFLRNIDVSIENALEKSEADLQREILLRVAEFNEQFSNHVGKAAELIKSIKKGMRDFDLVIGVPDVQAVRFDLSLSDVLDDVIQEKTERKTYQRRKSGAWGSVCRMFNTDDWGWESYQEDVEIFQVDIKKINKDVTSGVAQAFDALRESAVADIKGQLVEQTDVFFNALRKKIEHIRGDLIGSLSDHQRSEQEQRALAKELSSLERPVPGLLDDSDKLSKEVKALLEAGKGAAP